MKKQTLFILAMAAALQVSAEELKEAQSAFVEDYKQMIQEGKI